MGYYQNFNDFEEVRPPKRRKPPQAFRWLAVAAVSGLVGSGATLACLPALARQLNLQPAVSPTATQETQPQAASGVDGTEQTSSSGQPVVLSDALATAAAGGSITSVYKKAEPSVVAVVNYGTVSNFFTQQAQLQETGVGSGVLFYKDSQYGYIVTNNHVVDGAAKLEVVLYTGKHVAATLVGTDPFTDLAVLKIPVKNVQRIQPLQFANSDNIQVGEPAIAIGTPMGLDFAETVTAGIVSGKQRLMPVEQPETQQVLDYQSVIQTDAAINPGNSGGPLLNSQGQVIGINSSKIAAQGFEGMGFAIPSNQVQQVAQQLMKNGHMVYPALGIVPYSLETLPQQFWPNVPVDYGVFVYSVTSAQAKAAGLKAGDVIVALNGRTVQNEADLRTALFKLKPGDTVKLTVYRDSQRLTLSVKLGSVNSDSVSSNSNTQPQTTDGWMSGLPDLFGSGDGSGLFGW
ncbi:MAG: trypsin-like peptidase domain-containing protein [Alicyclobacillaceae bacterium]|nr:trypsin-like peptidase domain-containing protein [Alicyclobacillaceae bacterium]